MDRLKGLMGSRRFWLAVGTIVGSVVTKQVSPDTITAVGDLAQQIGGALWLN